MLKAEQILKILKKYGFYSLNRAPYLYQNGNELGVYFLLPTKHYGTLERILYFQEASIVEEEIYKYWWYTTNKDKLPVSLELDNFETINPKIIYKYKDTILTRELMQHFYENKDFLITPNEVIKKNQLLRTAQLMIQIVKEKFKLQTETYFKVLEKAEELRNVTNEYHKRLNVLKNEKVQILENCEVLMADQDESEALVDTLQQELNGLDTTPKIREFINTLFAYLLQLEISDAHLQNMYLLNRYPYEIADIKKKIVVLDEALKNKKKLFKIKADVLLNLEKIDTSSECNKMISIESYMEKEKSQIIQKYQNRYTIDENVLGDYLINFENLTIEIPPMIQNTMIEEFAREDFYKDIRDSYAKLSNKEKSACFVASSYLKDCLNILILKNAQYDVNLNDVISKLILSNQIDLFNDAFVTLDHYFNTKIRVKYFSILNTNSFELFLESLIEVIRILEKINIGLDKSFSGYYNSKEKGIIPLHLKNIYNTNKFAYVANLLPKVPLYYSPTSIVKVVDVLENTELVERKNETIFLLKNKINIKTQPEKVMVVKYEIENVIKRKDYNLVSKIQEKNRCIYYEDVIYNKEIGGSYE